MTSIFDQYEVASQIHQQENPVAEPMTSSGYINMQQDETPIFSKKKMMFNPSDSITHLSIASDYLVLAMANGKLFRMDLERPDQNEEINYAKYVHTNSKLTNMFMDPLGYHLLLSFSPHNKDGSPELHYLHRKSLKLKTVTKSKSEVSAVGWNLDNCSESSTGPILLGTSQGLLLETDIEADSDKMFTASQQYWRQLFDVGEPITGIQFYRISNTKKFVIFITSPKRLYQFMGDAVFSEEKPSLQSVFNTYLTTPATGFLEIPSSLKYSKLQFYYDKHNVPKTFAWMIESGIFFGQLDPYTEVNNQYTQGSLINYPVEDDEGKDKVPLSFVLTEFHVLLMYSDRVKVVSLLNHQLVCEDFFSEAHGNLNDIIKDPIKRTIFAFTDKKIFRYKVVREERNVWRVYCDKELFDLAKQYCGNNPAFIDIVNVKQAELLFAKGEYEKCAEIYADTQSSFETVCLKFLEVDQINALRIYLNKRLNVLEDDDNTRIIMIVIWLTELYLAQLGQLRHAGQKDSVKYRQVQSDFEVFLKQPKVSKCMLHVKTVIYDLMASHGDKKNLIHLSQLNEDYENVIILNLYNKSYSEVLTALQAFKKPDLFYQFASVLLEEVPKSTVNALISQGSRLSPLRLLPAFLSCEKDETHAIEIIRYLEFMLEHYNVKDKAIHNYLLTLYVEYDQEALMRYLAREGNEAVLLHYDVHYALRLCREKNLPEACVKLSALLGLWESAVELALQVDIALAKSIAEMPEDEDVQRQLWLSIAEHVITKNQDIQEAMSFLQVCPLIKIEDILPFFSDIVTIDHFREPICQSLEEYNNKIDELKLEIDEATKSAEYVRAEIQSFRNRSVMVSVSDECYLCELALLLRPFYLFPCGHRFHSDCLLAEMKPVIGAAQAKKLQDIQSQLNVLSNIELSAATSSGLPLREVLRNEIDDIVAKECIFCGEYMITCIDKPFIEDEDWERVNKEWE